jgi:excisionase family DNA binding protein
MNGHRKSFGAPADAKLRAAVGGSATEPVLPFDNKPTRSLPLLLTISEVAELLKISIPGARRLQQKRRIPFIKVGGSIRFATNDVLSYLEKQRVESIG